MEDLCRLTPTNPASIYILIASFKWLRSIEASYKREAKQQSECSKREASEGSNAIEGYLQIYKAIPGRVSFQGWLCEFLARFLPDTT